MTERPKFEELSDGGIGEFGEIGDGVNFQPWAEIVFREALSRMGIEARTKLFDTMSWTAPSAAALTSFSTCTGVPSCAPNSAARERDSTSRLTASVMVWRSIGFR